MCIESLACPLLYTPNNVILFLFTLNRPCKTITSKWVYNVF